MVTESAQPLLIASRSKRIGAFIIDHVTITMLIALVLLISVGPDFISEDGMQNLIPAMTGVIIPGILLYLGKDSIGGISFGKWVVGLMVRDASDPNEIPSVGRLFVRNLFLIIWPIEFIVLASSSNKTRLGNKLSKTAVFDNPTRPKPLAITLALVIPVITFFVFIFLFVGSSMKQSDAYKAAINEIAHDQAIIKDTGGIKGYGVMPTGNISIANGNGKAQFQIQVLGNEHDVKVDIYLTKESGGEWKVIDLDR